MLIWGTADKTSFPSEGLIDRVNELAATAPPPAECVPPLDTSERVVRCWLSAPVAPGLPKFTLVSRIQETGDWLVDFNGADQVATEARRHLRQRVARAGDDHHAIVQEAAAGQYVAHVVVVVKLDGVVRTADQLRHGLLVELLQAQLIAQQPPAQRADDQVRLDTGGGEALEEALRIGRPAGPGDGDDDAHGRIVAPRPSIQRSNGGK